MKKHILLIGIAAAGMIVGCSKEEPKVNPYKAEPIKVEVPPPLPSAVHRVGDSCAQIEMQKVCRDGADGKQVCNTTPTVEFDADGKHIACFSEKAKFVSIDPLQGWGILTGNAVAKVGEGCQEKNDTVIFTDKDYFPLVCEKGKLKRAVVDIPAQKSATSSK